MAGGDREKALDAALANIEKQFGKGSVMRLGDDTRAPLEIIPTGSIALDIALGLGGLPRGRVVEIYGPESSGKTTVALHAVANAQRAGGIVAFIDAEHALDPDYAKALGVDTDALLVSQPDSGEQALEIADMLTRSGRPRPDRHRLGGRPGAPRRDRGRDGRQPRRPPGPPDVPGAAQDDRRAQQRRHHSDLHQPAAREDRGHVRMLFGDSQVTLADGTKKRIDQIVRQKLPVEVLTYDPDLDAVVARKVVNWFDNGPTDRFLRFQVARPTGPGRTHRLRAHF